MNLKYYIKTIVLKLVKTIQVPVYQEKFRTAGNTDEAPAQNAMTSVSDVIVMAIPLVLIVFPIRDSISSLLDVAASPDIKINMSSTPIPKSRGKKLKLDLNLFREVFSLDYLRN